VEAVFPGITPDGPFVRGARDARAENRVVFPKASLIGPCRLFENFRMDAPYRRPRQQAAVILRLAIFHGRDNVGVADSRVDQGVILMFTFENEGDQKKGKWGAFRSLCPVFNGRHRQPFRSGPGSAVDGPRPIDRGKTKSES